MYHQTRPYPETGLSKKEHTLMTIAKARFGRTKHLSTRTLFGAAARLAA